MHPKVWTGEIKTKTLKCAKIFCFVLVEMRTDTVKNQCGEGQVGFTRGCVLWFEVCGKLLDVSKILLKYVSYSKLRSPISSLKTKKKNGAM